MRRTAPGPPAPVEPVAARHPLTLLWYCAAEMAVAKARRARSRYPCASLHKTFWAEMPQGQLSYALGKLYRRTVMRDDAAEEANLMHPLGPVTWRGRCGTWVPR